MPDKIKLKLEFGMDTEVTYTNYKGETRRRKIRPIHLWYGTSVYHEEEQWLLEVIDLENRMYRTFALKDISA